MTLQYFPSLSIASPWHFLFCRSLIKAYTEDYRVDTWLARSKRVLKMQQHRCTVRRSYHSSAKYHDENLFRMHICYKYKRMDEFSLCKGQCFYQLFFPWLHKDNRNKGAKAKHHHIYHKESGILDLQNDISASCFVWSHRPPPVFVSPAGKCFQQWAQSAPLVRRNDLVSCSFSTLPPFLLQLFNCISWLRKLYSLIYVTANYQGISQIFSWWR